MSIYDITFEAQIEHLISPLRRKPKVLDFLFCLIKPLQYLRDLYLGDYRTGASYPFYDNSTIYLKGDRVITKDNSVYEKLNSSSGSGIKPYGQEPDSSICWRKVLNDYRGTIERTAYNNQMILLSYAVNRHFQTSPGGYIYFTHSTISGLTIHVPSGLYSTLGSTDQERVNTIYNAILPYLLAYVVLSGIVSY